MVNNRLSVDSYPTEYLNFLLTGALKEKVVVLPSLKRAQFAVQRINQLKSAMKREKHAQYTNVAKASVIARAEFTADGEPTGRGLLIAQPRDVDILGHFHSAGIEATELSTDPLAAFDADTLKHIAEGEGE